MKRRAIIAIPGAHAWCAEQPDAFNAKLLEFLVD